MNSDDAQENNFAAENFATELSSGQETGEASVCGFLESASSKSAGELDAEAVEGSHDEISPARTEDAAETTIVPPLSPLSRERALELEASLQEARKLLSKVLNERDHLRLEHRRVRVERDRLMGMWKVFPH